MEIVDLSIELYGGMPVFPGDPEVVIETIHTIGREGWNLRRIQMTSHDGTHVNVPTHMVPEGKTLDDFDLKNFCGPARIYVPGDPMNSGYAYIFRDQNIDSGIATEIKHIRPRFIGLSAAYDFDVAIEKDLLESGVISFERLTNLEDLPMVFEFYGMPLRIRGGDGSPVRAFAVVK